MGCLQAKLGPEQWGEALKELITKGAEQGIATLGKADGYLKNPKFALKLPSEVDFFYAALKKIGQSDSVDEMITLANKAAEQAAGSQETIGVFRETLGTLPVNESQQLFCADAPQSISLWYKKIAGDKLRASFRPVMEKALQSQKVVERWEKVRDVYLKIPSLPDIHLPDVKLPEVKLPEVKLPEVNLPKVSLGGLMSMLPGQTKTPEQIAAEQAQKAQQEAAEKAAKEEKERKEKAEKEERERKEKEEEEKKTKLKNLDLIGNFVAQAVEAFFAVMGEFEQTQRQSPEARASPRLKLAFVVVDQEKKQRAGK